MGNPLTDIATHVAKRAIDLMFDETERSLADRRAKDLHAARVMERHNERMRKEEAKADKDYDKIVSGFGLVAPSMEEAAGDAGAEAVDGSEKVDEAKLEAAVEGVLSRYEGAFDPSTLNAVFDPFTAGHLAAADEPTGNTRAAVILGSLVLLLEAQAEARTG